MMGRKRASQPYCFARFKPRSSGIHVPGNSLLNTTQIKQARRKGAHPDTSRTLLGPSHVRPFELRVPKREYAAACQILRL